MKRVIYITVLLLGYLQTEAQKSLDFIISIDDEIAISSLSGLKLIAVTAAGNKESITANYHPGNLTLSDDDYKTLLDTGIKTVYLDFNYIDRQGQTQHTYNYEIDLHKGWLQHYYYVLHIYNTTKKKYRKLFVASEGKEYVYEFDYPGGSTKLIRKKE